MHRVCFYIALVLLVCFSLVTQPCTAGTPQEFKVKAGYLLSLPMFAEFSPPSAACSTFTIAVVGDTPLHDVLRTTPGKRIKNLPVATRMVRDVSEMECCQVLFIAASERYRLQHLLPEAHRRGIMTISDMRDFTRLGGMVALVTINNRVTYDLNLSAARSANISFSSQLLKLVNDISN